MGRCREKNADTKKQNADRDEKMPMPFPPASVADAQCESRESKFQKTWVIKPKHSKILKVKNHGLPVYPNGKNNSRQDTFFVGW